MTKQDLTSEEYHPYYRTYINMISETVDLVEGFEVGFKNIEAFFKAIPKEKLEYKYAEDKWTVKEVFQHIIDTERIFMYRCLRVARHDKTALAGFEQNDYILPSKANSKTIEALLEEYRTTRQFSIVLLKSLSNEDLKCVGRASGYVMSARSAAFSTIGHEIWHMNIIKERYL
jgi:uncharacterized damage-inducible protein DinB